MACHGSRLHPLGIALGQESAQRTEPHSSSSPSDAENLQASSGNMTIQCGDATPANCERSRFQINQRIAQQLLLKRQGGRRVVGFAGASCCIIYFSNMNEDERNNLVTVLTNAGLPDATPHPFSDDAPRSCERHLEVISSLTTFEHPWTPWRKI